MCRESRRGTWVSCSADLLSSRIVFSIRSSRMIVIAGYLAHLFHEAALVASNDDMLRLRRLDRHVHDRRLCFSDSSQDGAHLTAQPTYLSLHRLRLLLQSELCLAIAA